MSALTGSRTRMPEDTRFLAVRVFQFRHERLEPLPGIEPRPSPYEGVVLSVDTTEA
jgi:hypothetical protein